MNKCKWHLCNKEAKRSFCSPKCKSKFYVTRYRHQLKIKAVEYKGGKCCKCGYNKNVKAMDFHHLDPTKKEFAIGANGLTHTWERVKKELKKCILVCRNCHSEIHDVPL
jgi:hypothetical protein